MRFPGAILTIDLPSIAANWRLLSSYIGDSECGAVVKADGYGVGSAEVGRCLQRAGCSHFFVANINEGINLRKSLGINSKIYILNGVGDKGAITEFDENSLVPVLNSIDDVDLWSAHAQHKGGRSGVLCFDTGMNRLGLSPNEAIKLSDQTYHLDGIKIDFVMSHLACADEPKNGMNAKQKGLFDKIRSNFPPLRASLSNSAGIFLNTTFHYDLVRPGAALFGISSKNYSAVNLRQLVGLKAKIIQIRSVDSESSVGYGGTVNVCANSRLATVAAGYADGYLWSLGNRGYGYAAGIKVPVVGRISMDLTTFDVTKVPANQINPGDEIELISPQHTIDDLAAEAGTIGYEILTSLGARYQRRYKEVIA
ncbi:MAG: alanine racemase [Pseudomonadota bacterium]|nr:alanine racemase [Pseudomonadota bacterium]